MPQPAGVRTNDWKPACHGLQQRGRRPLSHTRQVDRGKRKNVGGMQVPDNGGVIDVSDDIDVREVPGLRAQCARVRPVADDEDPKSGCLFKVGDGREQHVMSFHRVCASH